ncbi:MAG: cytochrome c maturation protein CcmE [Bacteroidetes bacterium]|nr:cytochrome c maturation protein CcmE [Bacteroidota bacterium]MBS1629576.1 cytochrome c maturation protein CcmE [Bacteroidota bacterium]
MKKSHILALILVAASISVVSAMFLDFSTYETFASAAQKPGKQYSVIGFLEKQMPMQYDPVKDPNHFSFYVKDKSGNIRQVIFNGARPTDIEKSEQLVMMGSMNGDVFRCNRIQMKCPSKYKNDQIAKGS